MTTLFTDPARPTPARQPRPNWRRRALVTAAAVATAGLALLPATAEAHVRVSADNTASGGFSALTFRVPTESATASTVKLTVKLPTDHPFLYVSTKPVPGWTVVTKTSKLPKPVESYGTTLTKAVSSVTWTASKGGAIKPGEYQEFSISVGPLPDPGTVLLPATQTYSDGTVVAWDQATPASGEEPEHPAPQLEVVAAAGADHGGSGQSADAQSASPAVSAAGADPHASTSDSLGRALGGLGLVAGLAALVVATLAWRRSGRGPIA